MSNVSSWKILTSSESAWEHMLDACRTAEKSIDLVQFAFGDEGAIIDALTVVLQKKVTEGVRVRLLIDTVGSFFFFQSALRTKLEAAGVEIIFHETTIPPSFTRLVPFFLRDHRKLLIFDEKEVHIGGVIIEERARSWRDTMVILKGSIVTDCLALFDTACEHAKCNTPIGRVLTGEGKEEFFLAGNSFRERHKDLYLAMVRAITTARHTIYITTPYFALTRGLRRALWYAKERGAEICFLFPKRSDNVLSDIIARFYYGRILRRGIKIFHYTESILHAKTISIDGRWATVGSCNLDWLSIWLNYELNLITNNKAFATELDQIFLKDLAKSEEVTLATKKWYGFW